MTTRKTPAYVRVAETLRSQIESGQYAPGDPLPAEPRLAQQEDVSQSTARDALRLVRSWGLAEARRGAGTYVRRQLPQIRRDATARYRAEKALVHRSEYERSSNGATEMDTGQNLTDTTFKAVFDQVPASNDLAKTFGVAAGTALLRRRHEQTDSSGVQWSAGSASYLLYDIASKNPALLEADNEPWPGGTQHQLSTIGIEVGRIVDEVSTRAPLPEEAAAMGMDQGAAVLVIKKITIAVTGEVVEVTQFVLPGDRTQLVYTIDLPRWDQS